MIDPAGKGEVIDGAAAALQPCWDRGSSGFQDLELDRPSCLLLHHARSRTHVTAELPRTQACGLCEFLDGEFVAQVAPGVGQDLLDPVGPRLKLRGRRIAIGRRSCGDRRRASLALPFDTSGPRSSSTSARVRSIPAVMQADVQTLPSAMKMRSSSTLLTDGAAAARVHGPNGSPPSCHRASPPRPGETPPVLVAATRRAVAAVTRNRSIRPGPIGRA